ncbi:MAG: AraC family transcriptional regulator [Chitinophagales bacterium]
MQNLGAFLPRYKQNNKLALLLVSPTFGRVPPEVAELYGLTHRKTHYFFVFMLKGQSTHGVDLQQFTVGANQLLFILPHQIHSLPTSKHGTDYFKLGFNEDCLSLLPKQYPFLLNPFNRQKIQFSPTAAARLKAIFQLLQNLLQVMDTPADLLLAHLNSLLTEINAAYFVGHNTPAEEHLSKYIRFKLYVEQQLTNQPPITEIAAKLALNPNNLYKMVKQYSGLSPKEYITQRLMLEAKRRLYYAESPSVKELAYSLGFNDPEYFARLFKKTTGQTIARFVHDLSGNE